MNSESCSRLSFVSLHRGYSYQVVSRKACTFNMGPFWKTWHSSQMTQYSFSVSILCLAYLIICVQNQDILKPLHFLCVQTCRLLKMTKILSSLFDQVMITTSRHALCLTYFLHDECSYCSCSSSKLLVVYHDEHGQIKKKRSKTKILFYAGKRNWVCLTSIFHVTIFKIFMNGGTCRSLRASSSSSSDVKATSI